MKPSKRYYLHSKVKKYFSRLLTKFIIRYLSNVSNDSTLRVLNHAILKEMQRLRSDEVEMIYEAELNGVIYAVTTTSIIKRVGERKES